MVEGKQDASAHSFYNGAQRGSQLCNKDRPKMAEAQTAAASNPAEPACRNYSALTGINVSVET